MKKLLSVSLILAFTAFGAGCKKKEDTTEAAETNGQTNGEEETGLRADRGVDIDKKVIKIGALNDESGPAAAIGKPYAIGKRILAEQVNAGGSGLLPEGWTVELIEKDHGYNPQKSVQSFNEMKDEVLFIGTSFGTPNTLPLRSMLEREKIVAYPASLSSKMAEHELTPPLAPAYYFEAMRAMDWAVEDAGEADKVKAGIVFQKDDYGQDGIYGWEEAAETHAVEIVSQQTVAPGQKDYTAVVKALQDAGANYVLLTTLPSATGPILGTAAQMKYQPKWLGNTPSWVDKFFDEKVLPPAVLANYYLVTGAPYWGEDGMTKFEEAFEKHGGDAERDWYILLSYLQGLAALEVATRAIEAEDITREGYLKQVHTIDGFDADGMMQPISWTSVPYVVSTETRVLQPDLENETWEELAPYATPKAYNAEQAQKEQ